MIIRLKGTATLATEPFIDDTLPYELHTVRRIHRHSTVISMSSCAIAYIYRRYIRSAQKSSLSNGIRNPPRLRAKAGKTNIALGGQGHRDRGWGARITGGLQRQAWARLQARPSAMRGVRRGL